MLLDRASGRQTSLTDPFDRSVEEGEYRLLFDTRPYFERSGLSAFYPEVSVVFSLDEPGANLHVPVLLSAFGYTTYKGT